MTSHHPLRREMDGLWRRKLWLGLTAGEQETRGQSSDTGVARHDGITTGRCAAVVRLNSGLNMRPARPARPQRLHLCRHPSNSSAVNHLHHRERGPTKAHPEHGRDCSALYLPTLSRNLGPIEIRHLCTTFDILGRLFIDNYKYDKCIKLSSNYLIKSVTKVTTYYFIIKIS